MIEKIMSGLGLGFVVRTLSKVLKKIDNPVTEKASILLNDVGDLLDTGAISETAQAEANRHLEEITKIAAQGEADKIESINKSLRAEIESQDTYVRRMRPTFGYLMAITWTAQMLGVAYIIIFDTNNADLILRAMESLGTIWAVALSVLGLYVYKRSEDKRLRF